VEGRLSGRLVMLGCFTLKGWAQHLYVLRELFRLTVQYSTFHSNIAVTPISLSFQCHCHSNITVTVTPMLLSFQYHCHCHSNVTVIPILLLFQYHCHCHSNVTVIPISLSLSLQCHCHSNITVIPISMSLSLQYCTVQYNIIYVCVC